MAEEKLKATNTTADIDLEPRSFFNRYFEKAQEANATSAASGSLPLDLPNEIERLWAWYLYCLTFSSRASNSRYDPEVARIQLDFVDLRFLAAAFQAQVLVSFLNGKSVLFRPPAHVQSVHGLHLLLHQDMWAPLTTAKPGRPMDGCIVQLDALPRRFAAFRGLWACVQHYDANEQCYWASVGVQTIPIQRGNMKIIMRRADDDKPPPRLASSAKGQSKGKHGKGPGPGMAPALRGIPDGSFEFQLLFHMICKDAAARLGETLQELRGAGNYQHNPCRDSVKFRPYPGAATGTGPWRNEMSLQAFLDHFAPSSEQEERWTCYKEKQSSEEAPPPPGAQPAWSPHPPHGPPSSSQTLQPVAASRAEQSPYPASHQQPQKSQDQRPMPVQQKQTEACKPSLPKQMPLQQSQRQTPFAAAAPWQNVFNVDEIGSSSTSTSMPLSALQGCTSAFSTSTSIPPFAVPAMLPKGQSSHDPVNCYQQPQQSPRLASSQPVQESTALAKRPKPPQAPPPPELLARSTVAAISLTPLLHVEEPRPQLFEASASTTRFEESEAWVFFDSTEYGQEYLSFSAGETIVRIKHPQEDDEWTFGMSKKTNKTGWVPAMLFRRRQMTAASAP